MADSGVAHIGTLIEEQKFGRFQAWLVFWICAM
jgi:hypothetical protein